MMTVSNGVSSGNTSARAEAIKAQAEKQQASKRPTTIPGSKADKVAQATAPGVVTPSQPARSTKIPASANMTKSRTDDTSTVTEGDIRQRAKGPTPDKVADAIARAEAAKKGADRELDASVAGKAKPAKAPKDPNLLSVSDIAKESGIDPKRARARLRGAGKKATEGRWDRVVRGSEAHAEIQGLIADPKPDAAK